MVCQFGFLCGVTLATLYRGIGVVLSQFGNVSGNSSGTGSATITLDSALAVEAETLHCMTVATRPQNGVYFASNVLSHGLMHDDLGRHAIAEKAPGMSGRVYWLLSKGFLDTAAQWMVKSYLEASEPWCFSKRN